MSNKYCTKWIYNYLKENIAEKNINQDFRLKNIDEKRIYYIE